LVEGTVLAGEGGKAEPKSWWIERDGRVLVSIGKSAWSVSQGRDLVTLQRFRVGNGTFVASSSRAYDVRAGTFMSLPTECAALARRRDALFLLCNRKSRSRSGFDDMPSI